MKLLTETCSRRNSTEIKSVKRNKINRMKTFGVGEHIVVVIKEMLTTDHQSIITP